MVNIGDTEVFAVVNTCMIASWLFFSPMLLALLSEGVWLMIDDGPLPPFGTDFGISSDGSTTADGPGSMMEGRVLGCRYSSASAIVLGTSTLEAPAAPAAAAAAAAAAIATGASVRMRSFSSWFVYDGRRMNLSPGIIR
uniref:Uncharacterized protein n=1 Tax=Anopheles atroparvus TaxID=41427 RepID=A0A182J4S6_ANOAO